MTFTDADMDYLDRRLQDAEDRKRKLDGIKAEWKDLKNDGVKKQYCNSLEELIQDLEQELYWEKMEIRKLKGVRDNFGGLFLFSLMINLCALFVVIFVD